MSNLKRYRINWHMEETYLSGDGAWCMFDDVQSELAALREELADCKRSNEILRNQAPSEIYAQRLTAAEQRNAELTGVVRDLVDGKGLSLITLKELIGYTTKPTKSGASE